MYRTFVHPCPGCLCEFGWLTLTWGTRYRNPRHVPLTEDQLLGLRERIEGVVVDAEDIRAAGGSSRTRESHVQKVYVTKEQDSVSILRNGRSACTVY